MQLVRHWPAADGVQTPAPRGQKPEAEPVNRQQSLRAVQPVSIPLPGSALIQLPVLDRAEEKIANAVNRINRVVSGLPAIKIDAAVKWAEEKAGFAFAEHQRAAVKNALAHKLSILTGGPGTGKTTCLRALVDVLKAKKIRVHLAAPTGRAAQRLAETTGGFASTIHRLLKYDPAKGGFTANESSPLATDFLIVDEASMLDTRLAAALLQAVPSRAHLLLVGDTDQLPSVGAGNILKDLIATERVPVTRLTVIYRQKEQSQIITTAHAINAGDPSLPPAANDLASAQAWSDLTFIVADSAEDCLAKTIALCTEFIPLHWKWFDPVRDVQVLAPMHKGTAGVGNLNLQLQAALNPHAKGFRSPNGEFRPGDKVIQLRNDYDRNLFNGDIGAVTAIDAEAGTLTAEFDGETHTFDRGALGNLALAYAISIHKSQGSEYPVVIVPLLKAHFMMLQRNLIYTAITRGKKKVFLVGEPAAYAMAVRNADSKLRTTHLREKIAAMQAIGVSPRL
jgi:exodeoxyribonuclease V alpha subunit